MPLDGHFIAKWAFCVTKKRVRLGFVWSVEALSQVTTESSSYCTLQPSAPPQHGFVRLATKCALCVLHWVGY